MPSLPTTFLIPILIIAPTNAPTVFIPKSITSKKPTFKTSWRHSMESDKQKAANTIQPIRRQESSRFVDATNSPRKNPKGTKAAMFEILSAGPCPLFRKMREKSSVRLFPEA